MRIEDEIKQKRFKNELVKALINIQFTSNWISSKQIKVFKPFDVSPQQYNILRILKGQHPGPATLKLLTERMIDKNSNTSRLVDKLQKKNLVERNVCEDNRRQVDILITQKGLNLLESMKEKVEETDDVIGRLSENEAIELNRLLDKIRS